MGLVVIAAAVALVLTLLTLATVALVQLVLLVTVRNTLVSLVLAGVYWFVASRRRQVARGFYSCTTVPTTAAETKATASDTETTVVTQEVQENSNKRETQPESAEPPVEDAVPTDRHSITSNASEADSCSDEVPVASAEHSAPQPSRLPDLRHCKWKHPSRSVAAAKCNDRSASNSPRRPERFDSPRSVAMEQKLMKTALEADGYWIGDFRAPPRSLPKRSSSMGPATPTSASASGSQFRRTSSQAV